ncbi:MAG: HNH endonuclease [Deltaproteobacteria bacterium]|nr:HNH endonuclease [Deltaproteobacteria bacterium]
MQKALFLNGVYRSVLDEILAAQKTSPASVYYLQPYSSEKIKLLSKSELTKDNPMSLYISTTDSLGMISYSADVIGWEDKREIPSNRLQALNQHIQKWQPGEEEIYMTAPGGRECVNLISIVNLRQFTNPISVGNLIKASDKSPLKVRTQAGRWSYVFELPDWVGKGRTYLKEQIDQELNELVKKSTETDAKARKDRLNKAPKLPEQVQIVSVAYKRNPDVIVEVLKRANGICEYCKKPAPFLRAKDGSPYLEIHHWTHLSEGGEDTIENAAALCPNCHSEFHFGQNTGGLKI